MTASLCSGTSVAEVVDRPDELATRDRDHAWVDLLHDLVPFVGKEVEEPGEIPHPVDDGAGRVADDVMEDERCPRALLHGGHGALDPAFGIFPVPDRGVEHHARVAALLELLDVRVLEDAVVDVARVAEGPEHPVGVSKRSEHILAASDLLVKGRRLVAVTERERVRVGVVSDPVTLVVRAPDRLPTLRRLELLADHEERALDLTPGQRVEHMVGDRRLRTVVEGERYSGHPRRHNRRFGRTFAPARRARVSYGADMRTLIGLAGEAEEAA